MYNMLYVYFLQSTVIAEIGNAECDLLLLGFKLKILRAVENTNYTAMYLHFVYCVSISKKDTKKFS